jgi:hypothetical protein
MKIRILLIFLVIIITTSCIAPRVSSSALNFNENSEKGMIIGSVTFPKKKPRYNHYFPRFISTNEISKEIVISPKVSFGEKHIGELDNGLTYLFALELNEDNYKFNTIRLGLVGIGGATKDYYIKDFLVNFNVKKGEITYLGNIVINEWAKKGDTLVKFSNEFEKDLKGLKIKMPNVNFDNATNSKTKIIYKN